MDILVNVVNQKLKVAANLKNLVSGTQEFIRFVFNLSDDWDGLLTFAQFAQDGKAYNTYLDEENGAHLPPEIKPGICTLMLYGSGGTVIATTNYLTLTIDENILVSDAQSTAISTSLYNQLVNSFNDLSDKVTELEKNGVTSDLVSDSVKEELDALLASGALANMTIEDGSISRRKVDTAFEATLVKADSAMQADVYDPQGMKTDIFAYTQNRVNTVQNSINSLQTRVTTMQNTVTSATEKVALVEATVDGLNSHVDMLQGSVNTLDNNVGSVQNKINIVETNVNNLENSVSALNSGLDLANKDIKNLSAKLTEAETNLESQIKTVSDNLTETETDLQEQIGVVSDDLAKSKAELEAADSSLQGQFANIRNEINDAYLVGESTYTTLGGSIRGVFAQAKEYTDTSFANYKSFTTEIVEALPEHGEEMVFYLVPNETGTKYEKYWWITDEDGEGKWDVFGGSATEIVSALPEIGESDVDYILNSEDGCFLYKWIDGSWKMVSGSAAIVVEELPENGNEFTDYYVKGNDNVYGHYRYVDGDFYRIGSDSYTKGQIDEKLAAAEGKITTNEAYITSVSQTLTNLQQEVSNIDTEGYTYYATYGDAVLANGEEAQNVYTLYEVKNDVETIKSQFVMAGGGGGSTSATNLVVEKVTKSPLVVTSTDKIEIQINFSSTDSDGDTLGGTYTWKLGNSILSSGTLVQGLNTFDLTEYATVGTQKFTLTVVDEGGTMAVKTWTVQVVSVRIESAFNDKITYEAERTVSFTYTPYGSIPKTVHFILDGTELPSVTTSASGTLQSYTLPAQTHGAHLLECYMTAVVDSTTIETDHIFKDVIWYDSASNVPVIGCIYRNDYYGDVAVRQYDSTTIPYYVYDPSTSTPTVTHTVGEDIISTQKLSSSAATWVFKESAIGKHTLVISCRDTSVEIVVDVAELGIDVEPITANLAFDFNPTGRSNTSEDRLWKDQNNQEVSMSVSDNFDWANGGYQLDADGNQYFCVKAGTTATINYNLFEADASIHGSEFKVIFRTTNVRDPNAIFLSCASDATVVGLQMGAHAAQLMTSGTGSQPLHMPYSEDDIIEFEFNINPLDTENVEATSVIMSYEDGVGYKPLIYDANHRLYQFAPVPITIGSVDCDVHIYRMKAYSSSLSDSNILSNFIADARDSETMLDRYNRNQIYNENNAITPEFVAEACPDLKIIKIDCPYFTQDKSEMIKNTTVECIHKNGSAILDNWKAINCYHSGQGTTSNEYGYAGRNLNIYMCFDGIYQNKNVTYDPNYLTELTLGDGTKYTDGTGKVTLTRNSVPNSLFNIKVNIASSENANNALLQKRFHQYLPYTPVSAKRDPNTKTTMEFVNCVVFIRENNPDVSTHREFQDNEWHFYAIGNIGDSKDTDRTRTNDPDDHNEFVVEITDNTMPNSAFPSGVTDENGKQVYPISASQWVVGNPAYDSLHNEWDSTFEFRYSHPDITDEEEAANIQIWNDMYEWLVTSSDEQFVSELGDWFIEDAAMYMYLFTERYTMLDNRAKNTFWHWGKVYISDTEATEMGEEKAAWFTLDNEKAAIHNGYRFDFWDYDNDTSLGINNSGEMTQPYGKEDTDYRIDGDPNSGYIFNAAESVFFCRIRDLMYDKLQSMYLSRETAGAWSSSGLIAEFDAWQEMFPEELWRLDIERKYNRTYQGGTRRFLETMMNGRKKYHRRQWERDQEPYMGSKYVSASVKADQIMFRCNTPQEAVVAPNYDLRIIPYSDMYINALYGNANTPIRIRAKAGVEYEIENPLTSAMDDTAILLYNCSRIKALNDLSGCYIHDNDFTKASKLQKLIIGNSTPGYTNGFLTELNIGNNPLLQELNVRNCPNLTGSINLSNCRNLEILYAEGTAITGILFATNGQISVAYLPESINSLTMRNLNYLTDLQVSYDNLESLVIENSIVDDLAILQDSVDTLRSVTIIGVDWILPDTTLLNSILKMNSSTLVGSVYINGQIRQQEILSYDAKWSDLDVTYNADNLVTQYLATYVNANGEFLYSTYVDRGTAPIDPVAEELIPIPTIESTAQYDYSYSGWDDITSVMLAPRTITATYSESIRSYTVTWYSRSGLSLGSVSAEYGSEVVYSGDTPTRTDEEGTYVYNLFAGWDKSTGFITGNTDVYAIWERAVLPEIGTELHDMTPTQIYGVATSGRADSYFEDKDYCDITLGHDFDFTNVESEVLAENMYLDGATVRNTGIKLFGENEESFTIAIDFRFTGTSVNNTLLACYEENGSEGFRLRYNNSPNVQWGNVNVNVGYGSYRDIVVLRHKKGEDKLYIYCSNGNDARNFSAAISKTELIRNRSTATEATLVLGAIQFLGDGGYDNYGTGMIHWCKIWHDDIGDANARKLASWSHETLRVEYCGSGRYRLAGDTSQKANMSFIANNLLSDRGYMMNSTNTNIGGWDSSLMREFCNTRLLDAIPTLWRNMLKRVKVSATAGGQSSEIIVSEDLIYLPSYYEVTGVQNPPYSEEGEWITWFTSDLSRVKYKGMIIPDDSVNYTGNTDPSLISSNAVKYGDIWHNTSTNVYYIYVDRDMINENGISVSSPASIGGGWLIADSWWMRTPNINYSLYFMLAYNNGGTNLNSANGTSAICMCFSI